MQTEEKSVINFGNHNFGHVLRSSAIFYFKKTSSFKTTISLLNYWKIKRNLETMIVASVRKMDGTLVLREDFEFNESYVINYTPNIIEESFEGSVEIEIFCLKSRFSRQKFFDRFFSGILGFRADFFWGKYWFQIFGPTGFVCSSGVLNQFRSRKTPGIAHKAA